MRRRPMGSATRQDFSRERGGHAVFVGNHVDLPSGYAESGVSRRSTAAVRGTQRWRYRVPAVPPPTGEGEFSWVDALSSLPFTGSIAASDSRTDPLKSATAIHWYSPSGWLITCCQRQTAWGVCGEIYNDQSCGCRAAYNDECWQRSTDPDFSRTWDQWGAGFPAWSEFAGLEAHFKRSRISRSWLL